MLKNIAVIIYSVSDFDRALDFYNNKLALKLIYKNKKTLWAEFEIGNTKLAIKKSEPFGNGSNPRVSISVKNIDTVVENLKYKGVKFLGEGKVVTEFYGKLVSFQDPDGNTIDLFEAGS